MLTLWGPDGSILLRRPFAAVVPQDRRAGDGRPEPARAARRPRRRPRQPDRGAWRGSSHKAVIMVYLSGGLSHQDTFDLKPDAPDGIRGEFKPIATRVPGIQIGEHLPRDRRRAWTSWPSSARSSACATSIRARRTSDRLPDGRRPSARAGPTSARSSPGCRAGRPGRAALRRPVPAMQHKPYNSPGPGFLGQALPGRRGWMATTWRS